VRAPFSSREMEETIRSEARLGRDTRVSAPSEVWGAEQQGEEMAPSGDARRAAEGGSEPPEDFPSLLGFWFAKAVVEMQRCLLNTLCLGSPGREPRVWGASAALTEMLLGGERRRRSLPV